MNNQKPKIFSGCLAWMFVVFTHLAMAQSASDIYIGKLELYGTPAISDLRPVTNNSEYSNQPYFFDASTLYYTQALPLPVDEPVNESVALQMDIFRHDILSAKGENLTLSAESEYSATPLPYADGLSVIRVNDAGKQELWALNNEGRPLTHLASNIEPVGYQVWLNDKELLLFVLGEPHSLQRVSAFDDKANKKNPQIIDTNIGASLYRFQNSDWFLYSRSVVGNQKDAQRDASNRLKAYNAMTGDVIELGDLPSDSAGDGQYFSIGPSGHMLTTSGKDLLMRQVIMKGEKLVMKDAWQKVELKGKNCQNGISRTAIAPLGDRVALVCMRGAD